MDRREKISGDNRHIPATTPEVGMILSEFAEALEQVQAKIDQVATRRSHTQNTLQALDSYLRSPFSESLFRCITKADGEYPEDYANAKTTNRPFPTPLALAVLFSLPFHSGIQPTNLLEASPSEQKYLQPAQSSQPKPHPEGRTHGKPVPLPAGAKTHSWEAFLGPSHNAISSETPLLKSWPPGGPQLLWEVKKGSGYS